MGSAGSEATALEAELAAARTTIDTLQAEVDARSTALADAEAASQAAIGEVTAERDALAAESSTDTSFAPWAGAVSTTACSVPGGPASMPNTGKW